MAMIMAGKQEPREAAQSQALGNSPRHAQKCIAVT